jgi:hypothetical protein
MSGDLAKPASQVIVEGKMRATDLKVCVGFFTAIVMIAGLLPTGSASGDNISGLKSQILSFEDVGMTVRDLAFYLATHNYDAKPAEGYVVLKIDGEMYKLIPNGDAPGICDIRAYT